MLKLLTPIAIIGLLIWLFVSKPLWGVVALVVLLLYFYFSKYTDLCIAKAMRLYTLEDFDGAFRWFEKAEKRGMNGKQRITYAYYLMREGRVEKAETILNNLLAFKLSPELKLPAKSNHAVLLMKTGRIDEAKEELEEIFEQYRNSNVYGSLGYLYILGDDMKKAEEFNLEGYDYNKDNTVILDNMVQLYTKLENYEEAYRYACELMEKKPAFIEAYYNAAVVEIKLGKNEDAKAHLEHALTIRPTFLTTVTREMLQALLDSITE